LNSSHLYQGNRRQMKMVKKSRVACFLKKKEIWYY